MREREFASPVAVPDIFLVLSRTSTAIDRCHSLGFLFPPPGAVASLPFLDINVNGVFCVTLDPFLTGFYLLTHEHGENFVCPAGILQGDPT